MNFNTGSLPRSVAPLFFLNRHFKYIIADFSVFQTEVLNEYLTRMKSRRTLAHYLLFLGGIYICKHKDKQELLWMSQVICFLLQIT